MYCSQHILHILSRNKLYFEKDIGVFEIHEAFAGQILSTLKAIASQQFANAKFGDKKVGEVNYDKLNTRGSSLAFLGHPLE
jgi:acetyl-CoA acetyltransferase